MFLHHDWNFLHIKPVFYFKKFFFQESCNGHKINKFISIKSIDQKDSIRKNYQQKGGHKAPKRNWLSTSKYYFVKRELLTPACSHFLIVGLRNDMGRAVKIANETTRIKSVVK